MHRRIFEVLTIRETCAYVEATYLITSHVCVALCTHPIESKTTSVVVITTLCSMQDNGC